MTFQVSIGFSGLDNPNGKDEQSKNYALFIGDTVVVNEVKKEYLLKKNLFLIKIFQNEPCTIYTSSKKDISHIAIILKDDGTQNDNVDDTPAIGPRRAVAEKNRVDFVLFFLI